MGRECTAAVVRAPGGEFTLEKVQLDEVRRHEVLIRLEASGVCRTDVMAQYVMPLPGVVGHEGAGIIEQVGSAVTKFKRGDRVMMSWPSCGVCPSCAAGRPYLCDEMGALLFSGARLDGSHTVQLDGQWISSPFFQQSSFATHAITPANSLVAAPPDMPVHMLAALTCGLMTGASSVVNTFKAGRDDQLIIFGAGAVGLSAVMAARLAGVPQIIAVDINDDRLELALELGATHALNVARDEIPARVKEIAPRGISHALDTTGMYSSWSIATQCLGMGGTLGVVHVPSGDTINLQCTEMIARAV